MRFWLRLGLMVMFFCLPALPGHPHEVRLPVVVDTDMGLDDVRALALLLSDPHLEVRAVVTTEGSASASAGARNLRRVLQYLGRTDIPMGQGAATDKAPPPWRGRSDALGGASLPDATIPDTVPDSVALLSTILRSTPERLTYICLGPLTNLATILTRNPELATKLNAVYYCGSPPDVPAPSWNTARDLPAARQVFAAGLPLFAFHLDPFPLRLDEEFLARFEKIDTPAASLIRLLYRGAETRKLLGTEHSQAWDDAIALYLADPSLGRWQADPRHPFLQTLSAWDTQRSQAVYLAILKGGSRQMLFPRQTVVLLQYPTRADDFQADVKPLVEDIIARHGLEEFKAVVLTNELHRHLGSFSILGAKMGIRAREILSAPLDDLRVESQAGLKPPLSCMNDGLQVATGASLGRGTIQVQAGAPRPAANFYLGGKKLTLSLKEDLFQLIQKEQEALAKRGGGLTPEYFREIRALALKHWLKLDRREIFQEHLEGAD